MNYFENQTKTQEKLNELKKYISDDIALEFNGTVEKNTELWNNIGYTECISVIDSSISIPSVLITIVGSGFKYFISGKSFSNFVINIEFEENKSSSGFDPIFLQNRLDLALRMISYIGKNKEKYRQYVFDKLNEEI